MKPIIVDIGSSSIKAGTNNLDSPKIIIPNYIGEIFDSGNGKTSETQQKKYISSECDKLIDTLKLYYPIKNGVFNDKDDIKNIFDYIYKELDMSNAQEIKSSPILISEPLMNSMQNKKNISEYLFETLEVPSLFFGSQPVLSLLGASRTNGLVLESGDKITQCCVVQEGYSLSNSFIRYDYGGSSVTDYLKYLLQNKGYFFNNSSNFQLIKKIKEKYSSAKYDIAQNNVENIKYDLPDGTSIDLGQEINQCTGILFEPELNNLSVLSIQKIIYDSLCSIDADLRAKLFGNIFLSGGNTSIKDMPFTLHKKIKEIIPKYLKVRLYTTNKPDSCCWIGGKVVTNLDEFKNMWINKNEWNEVGEKIFKEKII